MVDILGTDAVWVSLVSIRVTTCGKTLYIYLLAVLYSAPEGRTWNGVWWVLHWCCLLVSVFWIYTNPELRGSRSAPVIFFSWPHCSWSSVLVLFGGWSEPYSDGWAENRLDCWRSPEAGWTSSAGPFWRLCLYWVTTSGWRFLLKSIVISTVLSVLSSRLFRLHHRTSCSTPCLYADSSPSLMSLITVMSSASCLSVSLWSTDRWKLGVEDLRDDGVKSWSEVYKQNSSICARAVMVLQDVVQHYVDIIHRTVGPAGKLQGVQQGTCDVLHLGHNQSLKRFHD